MYSESRRREPPFLLSYPQLIIQLCPQRPIDSVVIKNCHVGLSKHVGEMKTKRASSTKEFGNVELSIDLNNQSFDVASHRFSFIIY